MKKSENSNIVADQKIADRLAMPPVSDDDLNLQDLFLEIAQDNYSKTLILKVEDCIFEDLYYDKINY